MCVCLLVVGENDWVGSDCAGIDYGGGGGGGGGGGVEVAYIDLSRGGSCILID